jgi:hypothetical protein
MFTLKVMPDDGEPFEIETASRDIVAWESGGTRQNPRSIGSLSDNLRMTDITDLAWFAADRRGLTELDIREWRKAVDIDITSKPGDDRDEEGDGEGLDPTRTAP